MKNANRNKTMERRAGILVPAGDFELPLRDRRMGFQRGSIRQCCGQYGLKARPRDDMVLIEGPRDRVQMLVEVIHFSRMRYRVAF